MKPNWWWIVMLGLLIVMEFNWVHLTDVDQVWGQEGCTVWEFGEATDSTDEPRLLGVLGNGTPFDVAWNADGSVLAVGSNQGVWLYSSVLERIGELAATEMTTFGWSRDGRKIAMVTATGGLMVWNVETRELLWETMILNGEIVELSWSHDSRVFAVIGKDACLRVISAEGDLEVMRAIPLSYVPLHITWHPTRAELGLIYNESLDEFEPQYMVEVWDMDTLTMTAQQRSGDMIYFFDVQDLIWSPNGEWLTIVPTYTAFTFWSPTTNDVDLIDAMMAGNAQVEAYDWWANGRGLLWSYYNYQVVAYDDPYVGSSTLSQALGGDLEYENTWGNADQVIDLAVQPMHETFAAITASTIYLVDRATNEEMAMREDFGLPLAVWDETAGRFVAEARGRLNVGRQIREVDYLTVEIVEDGNVITTIQDPYGAGFGGYTRLSPDGNVLLTLSGYSTLTLWDVTTGTARVQDIQLVLSPNIAVVAVATEPYAGNFSVRWSPDGQYFYALGADYNTLIEAVSVWDGVTGELIGTWEGSLVEIAWNPTSDLFAIATDQMLEVWNGATQEVVLSQARGERGVLSRMEWTADGQWLAGVNQEQEIEVIEVVTGETLVTLVGHEDEIWELAWSEGGSQLASVDTNGNLLIWNITTGETRLTLPHALWVVSIKWSPNGEQIAAVLGNKTIWVWDVR